MSVKFSLPSGRIRRVCPVCGEVKPMWRVQKRCDECAARAEADETVQRSRRTVAITGDIREITGNGHTGRKNATRCADCRLFDGKGWCAVKAWPVSPQSEACQYGRRLIASDRVKESVAKAKSAKASKKQKRNRNRR